MPRVLISRTGLDTEHRRAHGADSARDRTYPGACLGRADARSKAVARRRRSRRRRRGGGALVAPGNWEPGQGRTTLAYRGVEVIDAPVVIGESEPIVLDGRADSVLVEITYPDGVPVEGQELLGLA